MGASRYVASRCVGCLVPPLTTLRKRNTTAGTMGGASFLFFFFSRSESLGLMPTQFLPALGFYAFMLSGNETPSDLLVRCSKPNMLHVKFYVWFIVTRLSNLDPLAKNGETCRTVAPVPANE